MTDNNKTPKYFCKRCSSVKSPKIVFVVPDGEFDRSKGNPCEVIRTFPSQKISNSNGSIVEKPEFKARLLECNHYISYYEQSFTDLNSENLNEFETAEIRRKIDKEMIGKNGKEIEESVLFQADQYQTLLKYHSKGKLSQKYAIQYLDQLRERYSKTLSNEDEKIKFDTKFAHFLDLKPTTQKVKERELTSVEKAKNQQKAALEAAIALAKSKGFSMSELFGKKTESNNKSESNNKIGE